MRKSLCVYLIAVIAFILCLSGCTELRDAYIKANTSPTPAPLPPSIIGQGAVVNAAFCNDIDGDDVVETVTVCNINGQVVLYISDADDLSLIKVNYGSYVSAFITNTKKGSACVFVCVDLGSKNFVTSVFSFDGIKPVYQSGIATRVSSVSGTVIGTKDEVRFLGSWHSYCDYTLTNDFDLEAVSDSIIIMDDKEPLHVIRELPVQMLVDGLYTEQTLDAGTYIYPESTDGFTYLKFKLEDGSFGIINVHTSGTNYFIGGLIHDYEYFDNIEYWD